jgi:formylglycine-generating enzyme required for sulfatase activity
MTRRTLSYLFVTAALFLLIGDWLSGGATQRLVYGSATLSLDSEPPDASVLLDGDAVGVTPLDVAVRPGEHVLKLSHRFHPAVVEHIELARGAHVDRLVRLPDASGSLRIVSNPSGARVRIDGVEQSQPTPLTIDSIATGSHRIEVSADGRTSVESLRDVLPGETSAVSVELEPARMGTLMLSLSPPDAHVELVGHDATYRPGIELPVGRYLVRASRDGYAPRERNITVRLGENSEALQLTRLEATLTLDVKPSDAIVTVMSDGREQRYERPLQLQTGAVSIRARAVGYRNWRRDVALPADGLRVSVVLVRIDAKPGTKFADSMQAGGSGPELVVVGAGRFRMGDDTGASSPAHTVTLSQPFAIGIYEVTRGEYQAFAEATGTRMPAAAHAETPRHPVVDVDWQAAVAYSDWLTAQTGHGYRLPTEAEWEYVARAGATTPYTFGSDAAQLCHYGNVADRSAHQRFMGWSVVDCDDGAVRTAPVGQYRPNAFGVYDVHGNAAEWVLDCWHISYDNAPRDGVAWQVRGQCIDRVVRGGSWGNGADAVRVTDRRPASTPGDSRGFRVVREL